MALRRHPDGSVSVDLPEEYSGWSGGGYAAGSAEARQIGAVMDMVLADCLEMGELANGEGLDEGDEE